jgi:hypothetical protein
MYLQVKFDPISTLDFPFCLISFGLGFLMYSFISQTASTKWVSFGLNEKYLMKFSFNSPHENVSHLDSLILYHLCGMSSNVFKNL